MDKSVGIEVMSGSNHSVFRNLHGKTVQAVKNMLKDAFNIDYFAAAFVDGELVTTSHIIQCGEVLEFIRFGFKGADGEAYHIRLAKAIVTNDPKLREIAEQVKSLRLDSEDSIQVAIGMVATRFRELFGPVEDEGRVLLGTVVDLLIAHEERQKRLERMVIETRQKLDERLPELDKEWYTTKEAEELTPYKEFTIRQACNKGRLPEEMYKKNHRTRKWWISRTGIVWLRENDLLPA